MKHNVEVLHPYCCGMDVHTKTITACILTPIESQIKIFGTMTDDLEGLVWWLKEHSVPIVAMESTGVYWKPVYNILEDTGIKALVYAKALKGRISIVHQQLLSMQLSHIDELTESIDKIDKELDALTAPIPNFNEALELIDSIPGIGRQSAMTILIETGLDMSRFPTVKQLTAWGGLAPGNRESAGKTKPAKSRKGNKYLKAVLVQAAHSLHRKKDCHLHEQYQRIKARRGSKRAAVAVGHSILRIIYYLLVRNEKYQELGANYVSKKDKNHKIQRHVKELAKLGLVIPSELVNQQLANPA